MTAGQQIFEQGVKRGLERGLEQGLERGLERGTARSLIDIYEARFGEMPAGLRAAIEETHDEATLRGWLKLAGTRDAGELATTILSARPR